MERFRWLVRYYVFMLPAAASKYFVFDLVHRLFECANASCENVKKKKNVLGSERVLMQRCWPVHLNATRCQIAFKRKTPIHSYYETGLHACNLCQASACRDLQVSVINSRGYGGRSVRSVRLTLALQEEPSPRLRLPKCLLLGGAHEPEGDWNHLSHGFHIKE